MQRGAYISRLPSTPQMARYTAAPSNYPDPTVAQSIGPWWGSSLGGCRSCGLGQDVPAQPAAAVVAPTLPPSSSYNKVLFFGLAGLVLLLVLR